VLLEGSAQRIVDTFLQVTPCEHWPRGLDPSIERLNQGMIDRRGYPLSAAAARHH